MTKPSQPSFRPALPFPSALLAGARTAVVLGLFAALAGGFVASLTSAPAPEAAQLAAARARCLTGHC